MKSVLGLRRRGGLRPDGFRQARVSRRARRGAALVLVMACLLVVVLVGMSLLRAAVQHHRQVRRQQYGLQAFWLAESGALRAAARLAAKPDYQGETWRVSASQLSGRYAGVVTIRIEDPESARPRRVIIQAKYPTDDDRSVMEERSMLIPAASTTTPAPDPDPDPTPTPGGSF